MGGDECRHERWMHAARQTARLAQDAVALAEGERGAEDVVRATVPAQIDRTAPARQPGRESGDADEQANQTPTTQELLDRIHDVHHFLVSQTSDAHLSHVEAR